ncbi:MAG: hypothetical protein LUE27_06520 [Clostridia bacterium]|nr:hypothetical protein [Clostridia bacterium]
MTEEEFINVIRKYYTRSAEKIQAEVDMCKSIAQEHGISAEEVFESRAIFVMNPAVMLPRDDDI